MKKKRIIYCVFLKCTAEGLDFQIYPGKLGKFIYENISKEIWMQWQVQQTILINEEKLNMSYAADRKIVEDKMIEFLFSEVNYNITDVL